MLHSVSNRHLSRRPQLNTGEIHAGIGVDKMCMGGVFLPITRVFPVGVTPPMFHKFS